MGLAIHLLQLAHGHAILRALRTRERGLHGAEVEFEHIGVVGLRCAGIAPHALGLGVRLDQSNLLRRTTGEFQIAQRFFVDREDAAGAAVLRRHVGDGGAVGERQGRKPVTKVFDEFLDHAFLAQYLGDREHKVGGGGAGLQLPGELEADDLGNQHRHRLAEHGRLGFDAAHAPAEHAETVDHRRVRVGADEGVRVGLWAFPVAVLEHYATEEFEVDLMDDAGAGWHDLEIAERRLAPAQERIPLAIALELDGRIALECIGRSVMIDLHRVVDDQLSGRERIDALRVAAKFADGLAHRGQIDHTGHAGEVLHDHPRWSERDLMLRGGFGVPIEQRVDVAARHIHAVLEAQQVLEQDLQRVGQSRHLGLRQCAEIPVLVDLSAHLERAA